MLTDKEYKFSHFTSCTSWFFCMCVSNGVMTCNNCVNCSVNGLTSSAGKYEELEMTSGEAVRTGPDDAVSTTALAGSFASNTAAVATAAPAESASLVTDATADV